jgi:hypothetical protein
MKLKDLLPLVSEYTELRLEDTEGNTLDVYDGRDAISPEYGEYEVTFIYTELHLLSWTEVGRIVIEVKEA